MGVTGIGGLFFRAKDKDALSTWYLEHLGVGGPYGMWDTQAGTTVFQPFAADTDYFPAEKQWMLNLRVDDRDAMVAELKAKGIMVITNSDWDSPGVGKFARLHDPEGNAIELWQPDDE